MRNMVQWDKKQGPQKHPTIVILYNSAIDDYYSDKYINYEMIQLRFLVG